MGGEICLKYRKKTKFKQTDKERRDGENWSRVIKLFVLVPQLRLKPARKIHQVVLSVLHAYDVKFLQRTTTRIMTLPMETPATSARAISNRYNRFTKSLMI